MLAIKLALRWMLGCCAAFALLGQAAPSKAQEFAVGDEPPGRECSRRYCERDCERSCWSAIGTARDGEQEIWREGSCVEEFPALCDEDEDGDDESEEADSDEDGVSDEDDNCPEDSNRRQADCDRDGTGDDCDDDNSYTYYEGCIPCVTASRTFGIICERNFSSESYPLFIWSEGATEEEGDTEDGRWELCYPWSDLPYEREATCGD